MQDNSALCNTVWGKYEFGVFNPYLAPSPLQLWCMPVCTFADPPHCCRCVTMPGTWSPCPPTPPRLQPAKHPDCSGACRHCQACWMH